jgi:hypothetical protein
MFGTQIRRAGLAVAALALAVSVLTAPAAQATDQDISDSINPITTTPLSLRTDDADAALGISGPNLFKPAIEVIYLRKVRIDYPVNKTTYRYNLRNSGNVDFINGTTSDGMCWYQNGDGTTSGVDAWDESPNGMSGPLEKQKSHEFSFSCPNTLNGKALHHGLGIGRGFYGQTINQSVMERTESE